MLVPTPQARQAGDDHVSQLRREIAEAEVAELSEALAEAVLVEREAIANAGAIRSRLREAQAIVDGLSEASAAVPDAEDP